MKTDKRIKIRFFVLALLPFSTFAFAKDKYPAVMEYKSAVITFEKGSSQIGVDDQKTLNQAIVEAKSKGKITKIEVAAWSDNEHPITGDLSKADQSLAEMRLVAIKRDLKRDVGQLKYVHEYNMAEGSSWLGRHLHSSDAELDAVFAKKETGALARTDFALIKSEGAATKAVVILKIRDHR